MKNRNINVLLMVLSILVLSYSTSNAQTEPMYSQYMYNMLGVNPAYAGNREATSLNFFQRNQWIGLKGAPKTTSVSIDQAVHESNMGWGVQAYDDRLGVEAATGVNAMLSTKIRVSENGVLSGGLSIGLMNYKVNLNDVMNRYTPNDPSFVSTSKPSQWMPMVGAGLFYNTDKFYMGLSSPSLLQSRMAIYANLNSGIQKMDAFHLFLNAGYVLTLNEDVKLKPSTMIKMVSGAPIEFDLNTNIWLRDVVSLGASYRTGDAVVGMVETQINENLKMGYAYDMTISPLKYYNNGSHEILLRYEFSNNKAKVKSTRYF